MTEYCANFAHTMVSWIQESSTKTYQGYVRATNSVDDSWISRPFTVIIFQIRPGRGKEDRGYNQGQVQPGVHPQQASLGATPQKQRKHQYQQGAQHQLCGHGLIFTVKLSLDFHFKVCANLFAKLNVR